VAKLPAAALARAVSDVAGAPSARAV